MSVVVAILDSLRFMVRSRATLHLELLALRHQLAVANRSRRPRLRLTLLIVCCGRGSPSNGAAGARRSMSFSLRRCSLGTPRLPAVLDLEEPSPHRTPGRAPRCPRVDSRDLHGESPLGAPRIHGELQKLGISVSESTVAKYMRRHPRPPSQTWRTFLVNHASQIMVADFFMVPTLTLRLLFAFVILAHDRRRIVHVTVTAHPTAAWTAQQLRNAFPENRRPGICCTIAIRYLRRSRPPSKGWTFRGSPAPRSPWQNAYVERVIGSIRRECLDHVIVVKPRGFVAC